MGDLDFRIMNLLASTSKELKLKIEAILTGKDTHKRHEDPDARTITQSEAAKRLNVSRTTIFRMVREGILSAVPMRGKKRILLASVFDYTLKARSQNNVR